MEAQRLQAAMEYLTTYGWAILIIALVVAVLYSLGVFNPYNFVAKATPGSCIISRPYGPNTTAYMALQGACNNDIPQFVAQLSGSGSDIMFNSLNLQSNAFTITAWIMYTGNAAGLSPLISFSGNQEPSLDVPWSSGESLIYLGGSNYRYFSTPTVTNGAWHQIAFVVTGYGQNDIANSLIYVDGAAQTGVGVAESGLPLSRNPPLYIGYANTRYFTGSISNVQIYNASLNANAIGALYREGIGGVPVDLQNLVAWYTLNTNANDSSGNQFNGAATNVKYTSSWYNGYTAP